MNASRYASPETVELLLAAGANINARDQFGRTAIKLAGHSGHAATITLLINAGARVDEADIHGDTPLMSAARSGGPTAVMQVLLNAGAELEARDRNGWTPLMHAINSGSVESIEYLLDAGADPNPSVALGGTSVWHLVVKTESLRDTDVYWRLHDARF